MNLLENGVTLGNFTICTGVSLALGVMMALVYSRHEKYNHSYLAAIILLPAVVQTVIMIVNGNIGMGVAVAGAFSLIRFRSIPGKAKDIVVVFMAMATGLACGTGFLLIAIVFAITMSIAMYILGTIKINDGTDQEKLLKITIPESLNYAEVFDEVFNTYVDSLTLENVKTTTLGSLFKLTYRIRLKQEVTEKALIDALRCRNGNLEISIGRYMEQQDIL